MAFFRFKVTYWNEITKEFQQDSGFVFGENYGVAARKLEKWYTLKDLSSIDLLYQTDNDVVLLDEHIEYLFREEKKNG